jgi:hypothetical protein
MLSEIQIVVRGPANSGRYTLALLLTEYLNSLGMPAEFPTTEIPKPVSVPESLKMLEVEVMRMTRRAPGVPVTVIVEQLPRMKAVFENGDLRIVKISEFQHKAEEAVKALQDFAQDAVAHGVASDPESRFALNILKNAGIDPSSKPSDQPKPSTRRCASLVYRLELNKDIEFRGFWVVIDADSFTTAGSYRSIRHAREESGFEEFCLKDMSGSAVKEAVATEVADTREYRYSLRQAISDILAAPTFS